MRKTNVRMGKRILSGMFLGLALLAAGCAAPVAAPAPGSSEQRVKVGIDASLAPFASPGEKGAPVGLDIDLIQAVMAQAGLPYTLIDSGINIPTLLQQDCRIEMAAAALPVTAALKDIALVTEPYYTAGNSLLVKKGNLRIAGREQLQGMTVGSELGAPAEAEVAALPGVTAKPFTNFALAVMDLSNGYIDAVAADTPHARSALANPRNQLKIVGGEFGRVDYGIAVCKDRKQLYGQVSAALAALKANGTLEKLIAKWLPRP
jgi:polar amino acid transport system substrate-binding protein